MGLFESRYKLSIIERYPDGSERKVCDIGTFKDETELERWSRENKGELAKC